MGCVYSSKNSKILSLTQAKKESTVGDGVVVMEYNAGRKVFTVTVVSEDSIPRISSCLVK